MGLSEASDFQSITGKGVEGRVNGRQVSVGNRALVETRQTISPDVMNQAESLRSDGQTVVFVAVDGKLAGLVGVADPIKESTPEALRASRRRH